MVSDIGNGGGAKLATEHENPIDRVFIALVDKAAPLAHRCGATPNMITTLSVVAGLMASRAVWLGNRKLAFAGWALLAYFFDCLDGHMARKYNMCSKFGDYYDHLSDWIYYGALLYTAFVVRGFKPAYRSYATGIYALLIAAAIGMAWHFGCQETIFAQSEIEGTTSASCFRAPTLSLFNGLCPKADSQICLSRLLGCGTFTVLTVLIICVTVR